MSSGNAVGTAEAVKAGQPVGAGLAGDCWGSIQCSGEESGTFWQDLPLSGTAAERTGRLERRQRRWGDFAEGKEDLPE